MKLRGSICTGSSKREFDRLELRFSICPKEQFYLSFKDSHSSLDLCNPSSSTPLNIEMSEQKSPSKLTPPDYSFSVVKSSLFLSSVWHWEISLRGFRFCAVLKTGLKLTIEVISLSCWLAIALNPKRSTSF